MTGDRGRPRKQVSDIIEGALRGSVPPGGAAAWATLKMSELKGAESAEAQEDYIIADGLGVLMMSSENEPEESRTTRQELEQSRSYLLGEEPFPDHGMPGQREDDAHNKE